MAKHVAPRNRRDFLKLGAAGLAGTVVGLSRTSAAEVTPDPCVPGLFTVQGDVSGVIGPGETWHIVGDVNLTGDLIVEGTLTGIDTFTLEGNGFQILVQNGGRLNLLGVAGPAWQYVGEVETVNTGQSIVLRNLSRIMFHMNPGVQHLQNVALIDCGIQDLLDFYPIHFHHAGESVAGSSLVDVVVWRGKNHAFVPHESNGVSFVRCVAYQSRDDSFWYNPGDATNNTLYESCLVLEQSKRPRGAGARATGFWLGFGSNNVARNCVAAQVNGTQHSAGFLWPEAQGGAGWLVVDAVSHHNWNGAVHYTVGGNVEGFVGHDNTKYDFDQSTYRSSALLADMTLGSLQTNGTNDPSGVLRFVRCSADLLDVGQSPANPSGFVEHDDCSYGSVRVTNDSVMHRFNDCGLTPSDVVFPNGADPATVLSITEGGVEVHRFQSGSW